MTDIRVLKIATCKSLSGSSDLTYHLGCDAQDNLHIRLWSNSAGGLHSKHWFSLAAILAKLTADKPITSGTLRQVCPGSRNNGGFILAALQQEGLVKPIAGAEHGMSRVEPTAYLAEVQALIAAGTAIAIPPPANRRTLPVAKRAGVTAPVGTPLKRGSRR
jgi:hypothetical protein